MFLFKIEMEKIALNLHCLCASSNACSNLQETNEALAGELEDAYMLSRIVSLWLTLQTPYIM